ncbi:hypothetical protein M430DRAFT_36177 [Amorphotheca resinae ATCC 22711]|uniref:Uncharacterized protein n=1 Tax=Amorphotheca resinae ATCC 22711 TaxID=857342 RepID=A0A2T3AWC9_AMORE|nr:hypothetical protein M430DRAFT_36177 [Amorphotheca resinae ATCC 22711]PSS12969.1 hypothetical protein M430DRAFT_36177 [Amorphotheca resinae ATCC 22711]
MPCHAMPLTKFPSLRYLTLPYLTLPIRSPSQTGLPSMIPSIHPSIHPSLNPIQSITPSKKYDDPSAYLSPYQPESVLSSPRPPVPIRGAQPNFQAP